MELFRKETLKLVDGLPEYTYTHAFFAPIKIAHSGLVVGEGAHPSPHVPQDG